MSVKGFILGLFDRKPSQKKDKRRSSIAVIHPESFISDSKDEDVLSHGLVLGEIVLLSWIDKNKTNRKIPGYFKYEHLLDVDESMEKLAREGFKKDGTSRDSLTPKAYEVLEEYDYIPNNKNCREWMLRAIEYIASKDYKPTKEEITDILFEEDLQKRIEFASSNGDQEFYLKHLKREIKDSRFIKNSEKKGLIERFRLDARMIVLSDDYLTEREKDSLGLNVRLRIHREILGIATEEAILTYGDPMLVLSYLMSRCEMLERIKIDQKRMESIGIKEFRARVANDGEACDWCLSVDKDKIFSIKHNFVKEVVSNCHCMYGGQLMLSSITPF